MLLASRLLAIPIPRSTSSLPTRSRCTGCRCRKPCRHVILSPRPRPLTVGVETIARELGRVNNGNVITPDFRFQPPTDVPTILARNESRSSTPQNVSPFTTPPKQITSPTPSSAYPVNPQYSAESAASSRSNESGREPSSALFAIDFVRFVFDVLEEELNKVAWYRGSRYEIKPE